MTTRITAAALSLAAIAIPGSFVAAFSPGGRGSAGVRLPRQARRRLVALAPPSISVPSSPSRGGLAAAAASGQGPSSPPDDEDDGATPPPENPYADPNYPDLEFVNYDDPEYSADRGYDESELEMLAEQSSSADVDTTLEEIEAMREERRRKNDEYQFETYHASVLRGGERSLGEWTVFQTDTFMGSDVVAGRSPESAGVPRLLKWDRILKVVSRGKKVVTDPDAEWRVDGERIVHRERLARADDFPPLMMSDVDEDDATLAWEEEEAGHVTRPFWPSELGATDFRGQGGNMCVGKAYTICDARRLEDFEDDDGARRHEGPFREMRAEVGVQEDAMRFRVKLDYALLEEEEEEADPAAPPPLHLRTLTVCRETLDGYWPDPADNEKVEDAKDDDGAEEATKKASEVVRRRNQEDIAAALFGPPGAPGGLYDPPPVGSEERAAGNYMLLDFEGGATMLLPHRLDQHHGGDDDGGDAGAATGGDSMGWVTSLDWTPGKIRYQVDRKVNAGKGLKGLRTLELSEVRSDDAERWRPKDGGKDMRQ
ncbi:hypothetical protein ACHAWF_017937 [Thalassiosira exigua]